MAFDLLKAIFSHLYTGQATDPHQAVGGITSANIHRTLSLDASGNLNINTAASSGGTITAAGTATLANVASSATSVTLQAAAALRLGIIITNESTQRLLVKFGATASATSYSYPVPAGQTLELIGPTIYTGIIDGIWDAANGSARVTQLTA